MVKVLIVLIIVRWWNGRHCFLPMGTVFATVTGSSPVLTTKHNEQKYGTKTSAGLHMELAPSAEAS